MPDTHRRPRKMVTKQSHPKLRNRGKRCDHKDIHP